MHLLVINDSIGHCWRKFIQHFIGMVTRPMQV